MGTKSQLGGDSPNGLLRGAIANDGESGFPPAIRINDGLSRAAAIHETAEDKMKI